MNCLRMTREVLTKNSHIEFEVKRGKHWKYFLSYNGKRVMFTVTESKVGPREVKNSYCTLRKLIKSMDAEFKEAKEAIQY